MSVKILVVNPNTTSAVTDAFLVCARKAAPENVSFCGVTGRFGARIVTTRAENVIAGHSALDLVANHRSGFDAIILAISFDTALSEIRSLLDVPVIGITEAALQAAQRRTKRIGTVVFGEASRPLYETVFDNYCAEPVEMEVVQISSAAGYLSPEANETAVIKACHRLSESGAEAIVICGTAIVGIAARLSSRLTVPVYDGAEAVDACLSVLQRPPPPISTSRIEPIGESIGLSKALSDLLRGRR